MERPVVTVVGSANTDMVVKVRQLPKPGETVLGGDFTMAGGGKGANQAVAARRLGAEVFLVARLGGDVFGESAMEQYQADGLRTDYVFRDTISPSGVALIVVDDTGENLIAVAPGANSRLSPDDVAQARPAFENSQVVAIQLEIPLETVAAAVDLARQTGAMVVLNPAPAPAAGLSDSLLRSTDVINPNRGEASALSGVEVTDTPSAEVAGRALLRRGAKAVVLTLGRQGALVVATQTTQHVPAYPVRSIDATGAGDAFTGALAVALARGASLGKAAEYASVAAALATTRIGAQPSMPWQQEVDQMLRQFADSERTSHQSASTEYLGG